MERKDTAWSYTVRARAGFRCERCGAWAIDLAFTGGFLDAHHLRAKSNHGALRHDLLNGLALCRGMGSNNCHPYLDTHREEGKALAISLRPECAVLWEVK